MKKRSNTPGKKTSKTNSSNSPLKHSTTGDDTFESSGSDSYYSDDSQMIQERAREAEERERTESKIWRERANLPKNGQKW